MAGINQQIYSGCNQMKGYLGQQTEGYSRGQNRGSQRGREQRGQGQGKRREYERGQQQEYPQAVHQSNGSYDLNLMSSVQSSTCLLLLNRLAASSTSISLTRSLNLASANFSSSVFSFAVSPLSASASPSWAVPQACCCSWVTSSFFWQSRSISSLLFLLEFLISSSCSSNLLDLYRAASSLSRWIQRISSSILRSCSSFLLRSCSSLMLRYLLKVCLCSQSKSTSSFLSVLRSSSSRAYSSLVSACLIFSSAISLSRFSLFLISFSNCSNFCSNSSMVSSPSSCRICDSSSPLRPVSAISLSSYYFRGVLGQLFLEPYISQFYLSTIYFIQGGIQRKVILRACFYFKRWKKQYGFSLCTFYIFIFNYLIFCMKTERQSQFQQVTNKKSKGYYTKQLAALQNKGLQFQRSKKGIKKDNRSVCKESRQKKKLYIHSLQTIKKQQEIQIASLKDQINNLKKQLGYKYTHTQEINSHSGIKELFTEFKELINAIQIKDEAHIKRSLAVMRSRFGIAGRDRIKWMEEHLIRMVELAMPMHFRLLLENCDNSKAFFELLGGGQEMKTYRVNFSEDKKMILKQMKPKIKKAKQGYNKILQKLHEGWTQLKRHGEQSQRIIDQIEDKVNHPIFISNLLMTLDMHRSKDASIREIYPLNHFKQLSQQIFMEDQCMDLQPYLQKDDSVAFDMFFMNNNNDFH